MNRLRDAFRQEAGRVWRDKAKAESLGLHFNEETITETILFHLAKQFQRHELTVIPFTKSQESRNGADWEMWFVHGLQAVGLRVQAKRLFRQKGYASLGTKTSQIKDLIKDSRDCHPIFALYNDAVNYDQDGPECTCGSYRGRSYLGCTMASAYAVNKLTAWTPTNLEPLSVPWHCLLCPITSGGSLSMPEIVASSINARLIADTPATFRTDVGCKVVTTPKVLWYYLKSLYESESRAIATTQTALDEHSMLSEYLDGRVLAGVLLISNNGET